MKQIKCLSLILLIVSSQAGVILGPGCFAACTPVCCQLGVFKFAGLLGLVVDITGCAAACMAACAAELAIPGICFSEDTTFMNQTLLIHKI